MRATYTILGDEPEARRRAEALCVEQTIEFPADLVWKPGILDDVVGKILRVEPAGPDRCEVEVAFSPDVATGELPQLLNVLFGNSSLLPGIRLERFALPERLAAGFAGPRFGIAGLRRLLGVPERPLLCSAVKPMGLSAVELADLAGQLARGGVDLIKDDHGLADQPFSRFAERVERCAEAVESANAATGGRCLYLPNVTAPAAQVMERARFAVAHGAGGLLFCPGLAGYDALRTLSAEDALGVPVLSHPALQGAFVVSPDHGISHYALFGQINRLCGADAAIFPNHGGRFSFTPADCRRLQAGCTDPMSGFAPIFPVPAGGMTLARIPEMVGFYGPDVMLLIGGDLHRHGNLVESCRQFHTALAGSSRTV